MNHRRHMIPCAVVILVAVMLLATRRASPFAAGIGLVFLLCPLVMATAMWLMMRQPRDSESSSEHLEIHDRASRTGQR